MNAGASGALGRLRITAGVHELAAQFTLEHLADRVARQWLVAQHDPGRHLERGEPDRGERADILRVRRDPRPWLDNRCDLFPEYPVGQADDGRVEDGGVLEQDVFHPGAVDVLAAPDDDV